MILDNVWLSICVPSDDLMPSAIGAVRLPIKPIPILSMGVSGEPETGLICLLILARNDLLTDGAPLHHASWG